MMRAKFAPLLAFLISAGSAARADTEADAGARALEQMRGARVAMLDPDLPQYARCILHRLLPEDRTQGDWELVVFDEDQLALHVLPGRRMVLDAGLLRFVRTTDELAAAIAHELGHALARHGWDDRHGPEQEQEATRIAAELTSAAGFSPSEAIVFWRRIAAEPDAYLSAIHPNPGENARLLEETLPAARKQYERAVRRDVGPVCRKPIVPRAQIDLHYAALSIEEGGNR